MNRQPPAAARCLSPAKINLNLAIRGRRADGYHLLDSEMVAIGVFDTIQVEVHSGPPGVTLHAEGRPVPPGRDNLVYRAAALLADRYGLREQLRIRLDKRIPSGAGLGGGSSDAATTLRLVNELVGLGLTDDLLRAAALELGADVPFFVSCKPSRVEGIGERIRPLASWPRSPLVVAFDGPGLATADVYARYDASLTSENLASSIRVFPHLPGSRHRNDLEFAASQLDPGVDKLKQDLLARGAGEVGMSGSGSAVFAFFRDEETASTCARDLAEGGVWAAATRVLEAACPIERTGPEFDW